MEEAGISVAEKSVSREEQEREEEEETEEEEKEDEETAEQKGKYFTATLKTKRNQILASISAALGAFSLGTVLGWSSPAIPKLEYINEEEKSWVSSILALGAAFTCIYVGYLVDRLGRRITILIQLFPFAIGWLMLAFGKTPLLLCLGRFALGMAGGSICVVAPMYISEISEPSIRGALGTLFQLLLTIGILYVYVVGAFASVVVTSMSCLFWPLTAVISMYLLPESPYFLIMKGRTEAASKSLQWLRQTTHIETEFRELEEVLKEKKESLVAVLKTKSGRRSTLIILALMFFQQFSGINVVIFYSVFVFEVASTAISGYDATIVLGVVQILATAIATFLVDRTGRRVLMMVSLTGMSLSHLTLGVYFWYSGREAINWLPVLSVCVYIVSFSVGAGPLPWSMLGELLPAGAKGPISSLAVIANWMMVFAVTKTFTGLMEALGNAFPFWLYAANCGIGAVVIYFFLPETKFKTLDEIQLSLGVV